MFHNNYYFYPILKKGIRDFASSLKPHITYQWGLIKYGCSNLRLKMAKKKKEWRVPKWQFTTRALFPSANLMPAWSDHVRWLLEVGQVKWYLIKICGWPTRVCLTHKHANAPPPHPGVASQGCVGGSEDRWVQWEERWVKGGGSACMVWLWKGWGGGENLATVYQAAANPISLWPAFQPY